MFFVALSATLALICPAWSTPITGNFITFDQLGGQPYTVTYDDRSFIINNKRTILLGGSIHPPRVAVSDIPSIMSKARLDGLNHIQIYVFWNFHEPSYDFSGNHKYIWTGRANLSHFIEEASRAGLFVNVRIGPYVCAEWRWGGLPTWLLHYGETISYRDDNPVWKSEMETFVRAVTNVMEPFLARNGGPIILAQIENEYHGSSQSYIDWCGQLTVELKLDIPWVMCNGKSAKQTINTCNSNNCFGYAQTHSKSFPGQPLAWTEDWGWFESWVGRHVNTSDFDNHSPAEMANRVAVWFAVGGAHHNYYMWYGGNHLSHWAGSGITNKYSDFCNYRASGLPNEPKRSHLMRLHHVLAKVQKALLSDEVQAGKQVDVPCEKGNCGGKTVAYLYQAGGGTNQVTFLVNFDGTAHTLSWKQGKYSLPASSCSILDWSGKELFNTARVNTTGVPAISSKTVVSDLKWSSWHEGFPQTLIQLRGDHPIIVDMPLEQIRLVNDSSSEYLFYQTEVTFSSQATSINVKIGGRSANSYSAFLGDTYLGSIFNGQHTAADFSVSFQENMPILAHTPYTLTVVSSSLGIDNFQGVVTQRTSSYQDKKGITGKVVLNGVDVTNGKWSHWIGRTGELAKIAGAGANKVKWMSPANMTQAMTWYRTMFVTPKLVDGAVLMMDIGSPGVAGVGRGHFWVNGVDMGHYQSTVYKNPLEMAQRYYYIPRDVLRPDGTQNTIVLGEELPGVVLKSVKLVAESVVNA